MMYDIFLVDLDQTVLDFNKSEQQALKDMIEELGFKFDSQMHKTYSKINRALWHSFESGQMDREEIFKKRFVLFFESIGKPHSPLAEEIYFNNLAQNSHIIDGADVFLQQLNLLGSVYALTNGASHTQHRRLKKSGLGGYFKGCFISDQTPYKKPDVEFFEYAANNICNFKKERAVMIGDNLFTDILGGNNFGIDTIYLTQEDDTKLHNIKPTYLANSFEDALKFIKKQ